LFATGTFFNRPINIILGHIFFFGERNRLPEPGISFNITTTQPCRQGYFLNNFGKYLTAFGVYRAFFSFYCAPFGMAGQVTSP
jgi:hypothetical protein